MLEVENYAYCKARMKAHIMSIDEKTWHIVLIGWQLPKIDTKSGRVVKPEAQWTTKEDKLENANSKEFQSLCGVDL
ncbi:hypothetical protein CXB51_015466 [Gossypium anomalum]|uniref:Gag-pol polyprotein n=1 Tax=Gossypium anomalum TaxID=47600 RepID=A0A8J5Z2S1_9ROSI|nr:hypothetical protein CXB51_015466 [Gossypium anomalum]